MTVRKVLRAGVDHVPETTVEADLNDAEFELNELLDPLAWAEVSGQFAGTMKLAVALIDADGHPVGPCQNPQPIWNMTAGQAGETPPGCTFCLAPQVPCSAARDALATGTIVYADDQAGLSHAAIPLFLGNRPLGVLIVGQVLVKYPQPLALQRVAKHFGVSEQQLWNTAIHQVPLSRSRLRLYADLLGALGRAFLGQRYAAILDKKLHKTNERYRLMIEGSKSYAMFTVDAEGRVTSWNPGAQRLLGYVESEVKGNDYARFFTPEDIRNGIPKHQLRAVEPAGWLEDEGWRVRKDGTRFLSETITSRLGEGDALEYGKLFHDVTAERESAEAMLQTQKLESIGVLAGGIAHDFNNLLTTILGNVGLALAQVPESDETRPLLEQVERSSLQAAALISQLLSYAGTTTGIDTQFDLSKLVADLLPLLEMSIPKSVALALALAPGLPWISAHSIEIQQIVMNLVINGAEAIGKKGGKLNVSTGLAEFDSAEGGQSGGVYFQVKDTGCGMDAATRARIFDPFFTTKFTGRGLGLAAVSGIVRRLKGRLEVESALGKGSTFRVSLPGVPAQLIAKQPGSQKKETRGDGLILLVDDDLNVRNLVQMILARNGYSVVTAENGVEAVALFRREADRIRAVLMDMTMPVMGGSEAFVLMNEMRPDIPVIISTGHSDDLVDKQFSSAIAGIIRKPYTAVDLTRKIASILEKSKGRTNRMGG